MKFLSVLILLAFLGVNAASRVDSGEARREAVRKLAARAERGDAKALYDLASLHDRGYDSIPVDSARSTALYRLSATAGYPRAQNYLGFRYFRGEFVRQDVDSALYWLSKAAENGDISAANNLGYLLTESDIIPHDYEEAFRWFSKGAEAGLPESESQLADLYRQGLGIAADTVKATELYTMAIEGGLQDAELKLLSMMWRKWETLEPDSAFILGRYYYTHHAPTAGVCLLKTAEKGDIPDALALLGDAYSKGSGTAYNHEMGRLYFLRAAMLGQRDAQRIIGEMLDIFPDALSDSNLKEVITNYLKEHPDVTSEDVTSAGYWYSKAEGL